MDPAAYVRATLRPLSPDPTGVAPKLPRLQGIEAVVFDVYGTLLVSAAGDISLVGEGASFAAMERALDESGVRVAVDPARLVEAYDAALHEQREARRAEGVDHPEVDIREVWERILAEHGAGESPDRDRVERIALGYECAVNPTWPMPRAAETIAALRAAGLALGIVSNAQFYTPAVLHGLLDGTPDELGLDPDLMVYSFREREAKPSIRLFRRLAAAAAGKGIPPERVFYLGNDLGKDVLPASAAGFRTGLFAGDRRSLRTGEKGMAAAAECADAVLTDLPQVWEVVGVE